MKRLSLVITCYLLPVTYYFLPLKCQQLLQELVCGLYGPRVGLEAPLGDDHVGKLIRHINIGHFQCAGNKRTLFSYARRPDIG